MDSSKIVEMIIAEIRETVPELADEPITGADSMAELGVDSIERSEVILATMGKLGVKIPMVQLHGPKNIGELADLILDKSAG
ncbi:phosphopantetheine-binding protein [Breoghania sp.]|uniref:phosphopantetheine-binding protein n=1 Tax=Breoghania sp. TaxID=2065378 RepID=UPI0026383D2C|nr:phosphopantetheine-binding protein [Breoghania sp.]MDJ0933262.1 phosphopantetheine-binding protein [Breoghania sp.]